MPLFSMLIKQYFMFYLIYFYYFQCFLCVCVCVFFFKFDCLFFNPLYHPCITASCICNLEDYIPSLVLSSISAPLSHTHTHTYIYIYIYIHRHFEWFEIFTNELQQFINYSELNHIYFCLLGFVCYISKTFWGF